MAEKTVTMALLPGPDDACPVCATKHPPDMPHNAGSLYYMFRFRMAHGRDSTWADAMAHCKPDVIARWRKHLEGMGRWSEPDGEVIADPPAESYNHVMTADMPVEVIKLKGRENE